MVLANWPTTAHDDRVHVPTGGAQHVILEEKDEEEIAKEKVYKIFGVVGLFMILAGTLCQIIANVPSLLPK